MKDEEDDDEKRRQRAIVKGTIIVQIHKGKTEAQYVSVPTFRLSASRQ